MWPLLFLYLVAAVLADNDFTFTVTPVPGQAFTITWTPGTYSKVDIMLNNILDMEQPIITTSSPIATEIDNSGSWVWNVPSDIQGRYSLSIARDFRFPVSYSKPFTFGPYTISTVTYATTIPQSTECTSTTSATPTPTGINPFTFPSADYTYLRAGIESTIKWIPTTSGTISMILHANSAVKDTVIARNLSNSGFYLWTPGTELANPNGVPFYTYELIISDDADPSITSTSDGIKMLSPSYRTDFIGPFLPAVIGQAYEISWSPSTTPTISLVLQADIVNGPNTTIGDHINNNGSYTWQVPSSSTFVVPGVWNLAAVDDATGNVDAILQLVIDALQPPTCGPASAITPCISASMLITISAQATAAATRSASSIIVTRANATAPSGAAALSATSGTSGGGLTSGNQALKPFGAEMMMLLSFVMMIAMGLCRDL